MTMNIEQRTKAAVEKIEFNAERIEKSVSDISGHFVGDYVKGLQLNNRYDYTIIGNQSYKVRNNVALPFICSGDISADQRSLYPYDNAAEAKKAEVIAVNAADRADAAADAASASGEIHSTIAKGIAATVNGALFLVVSDKESGFSDLYKNDNGTGVYQGKTTLDSSVINYAGVSNSKSNAIADPFGPQIEGVVLGGGGKLALDGRYRIGYHEISDGVDIVYREMNDSTDVWALYLNFYSQIPDNTSNSTLVTGFIATTKDNPAFVSKVANGVQYKAGRVPVGTKYIVTTCSYINRNYVWDLQYGTDWIAPVPFSNGVDKNTLIINDAIVRDVSAHEKIDCRPSTVDLKRRIEQLPGLITEQGIANANVNISVAPVICDDKNTVLLGIDIDDGSLKTMTPLRQFAAVNHVIFAGQSLASGAHGSPIVSTTQPYKNISFNGIVRARPEDLTNFKPLVESNLGYVDGDGRGQTCVSTTANSITKRIIEEDGGTQDDYVILGSTTSRGNSYIENLNKGNAWWNDYMVNHIKKGFELCQSQGKTYQVPVVCWLQGEGNQTYSSSVQDYVNKLTQYLQDVNDLVLPRTNQTKRVKMLTYSLACNVTSESKGYVTRAYWQLSKNNPDFEIACPMYFLPYADAVHLTGIGYAWCGEYFGKAIKRMHVDSVDWTPLKPSNINRQGKLIQIDFTGAENGICIDTTNVGATKNHGFYLHKNGSEVVISEVRILGKNSIILVCASDVTSGSTLNYAMKYIGTGVDILNGASGNIRDNCTETTTINDTQYPLYNWLVPFEQEL